MKSVPVQFLVDSGSTLTLISYNVLMKMYTDKEITGLLTSLSINVWPFKPTVSRHSDYLR
jgi:hypothetical protein